MSNFKEVIRKIKNLETEKKSLLLEIEELKKLADEKATSLEREIASLRDDVRSLKMLMAQESSVKSSEIG